jgi:hypothetical protein
MQSDQEKTASEVETEEYMPLHEITIRQNRRTGELAWSIQADGDPHINDATLSRLREQYNAWRERFDQNPNLLEELAADMGVKLWSEDPEAEDFVEAR